MRHAVAAKIVRDLSDRFKDIQVMRHWLAVPWEARNRFYTEKAICLIVNRGKNRDLLVFEHANLEIDSFEKNLKIAVDTKRARE